MKYNNKFKYFYWGPCVTRFILSDELCNGLLDKGRKDKEDARTDLAGHLDEEFKYTQNDKNWFVEKFNPYLNDHINFMNEYYNRQHNVTVHLNSLWINYMKNNEFNPPHIHSGQLSFVIYLKVPKELKEENKNYIGTDTCGPGGIRFTNDLKNNELIVSELSLFPEEKECFIFPAGLTHMVFPYKSNCERISVSGNFDFIGNSVGNR